MLIRNYHWIGLAIIVSVFFAMNLGVLEREEESLYEKTIVMPYVNNCQDLMPSDQRSVLKLYSFCISDIVFGDIKVVPMIYSIGIIIMTFLFANKLTKTKYAGLIACGLLANLKIFYSTSPIVDTSGDWAFFLLVSLYVVYKKPALAGVVLFFSLFAKGIGLVYIPIMIYMILNFDIERKEKRIAIISILSVVPCALLYTLLIGNNILQTTVPFGFFPHHLNYDAIFWRAFDIRQDEMTFVIFVPFVVSGLYFLKSNKMSRPIIVMIIYTYSLIFLIPLLSDYDMGNHRLIPMVAFLCIGVSIIVHQFEPLIMRYFYRLPYVKNIKCN